MVLKALFGKKGTGQDSTTASVPGMKPAAKNESAEKPAATTSPSALSASTANPVNTAEGAPNEPSPAVHLEQAMMDNARSDTPDSRKKVYQELLFSDLLLLLAEPEPDAPPVAKEPGNLSVAILSNSAGIQFSAAFTSAAAARRWRADGGQYVSVRGQDIFKLLEPSPAEVIVINAGSAPFIVLPKVEYKQLALGIVPQGGPSPVQAASEAPAAQGGGAQGTEPGAEGAQPSDQMQVAFPPDVFTDDQKSYAISIMKNTSQVVASALGAILPPGGDANNGWVRTLFIRVEGVEETAEGMQAFCAGLRAEIAANDALFKDIGFEVGVMPDPNFWVAMHQNNFVLFDHKPPAIPQAPEKEGVVDAQMG